VNWRPWLEDRALRQMQGLPPEAFDMLVRTLARICDDPYDPVFSAPVPPVAGTEADTRLPPGVDWLTQNLVSLADGPRGGHRISL
jgi:hypothetical protein